jgi:type IV pilus assembly protein PilO
MNLNVANKDVVVKLIVGVSILSLGFIFGYVEYVYMPYSSRIEKSQKKLDKMTAEINRAIAVANKEKVLTKEVESWKEKEVEAEKRLPSGKEVSDLIYTVMNLCKRNGVEVNSIQPMETKDREYFKETNYRMSVKTKYHNFGRFLGSLSQADRIFSVKDVTMAKARDDISINFILISFQYKAHKK